MFLPERLVAARTLLGVTQEQLAAASGVQQAMVSMVEKYRRDFTDQLAHQFADAMGLPVEFFNVQPRTVPGDSLHFRKRAATRVRDTARARALFVEGFRITEDLLDGSGYPTPNLPVVSDDADEVPRDRIESLALETRAALGVDADSPVTNVLRTLERSGIAVAPMGFPDNALDGHFGMSWSAGRSKPAFVAYIGGSGDRDRFTLAHELGHIVLHSHRHASDPEAEAHAFAGAFLMPADRARDLIPADATLNTLARVKAGWGISIAALIMRGKGLATLSDARVATLYKQLSSRGWRTNEPVDVSPESPRLLFRLMQARFGERPFNNPAIVPELALPVMTIRSLAPSPPTAAKEQGTRPVRMIGQR